MKTILIPSDFSKTANNAACYAMELAKFINAKVILLNVYHIPYIVTEAPILIPSLDEIEIESIKRITDCEKELQNKYGKSVSIEKMARAGYLVDEIKDIVKERKIDLIVMGISDNGKLSEFIGSNAIKVTKNINCQTLIIPEESKFKKIENIAFACDYESTTDSPAIKQLKIFVQLFNAKLMIFNVLKPHTEPSYSHAISGLKIENIFEDTNHLVYFPENEDLVLAINEFVEKHNVDILVMMPKKHNLFAHLFQQTKTKKVAFNSHIPLLAIRE